MGTKAFAMKEALITTAKALPAFSFLNDEDSIWDSAYSGTTRPRQLLWFGEIVWSSDRAVAFGRTPTTREEEFNIRVGIEVNDHDETQKEANDKVELILQALELMVDDYRAFGIDGIVSMGVVPVGLGEGPGGAEGGRAAFMALQVNVRVRK